MAANKELRTAQSLSPLSNSQSYLLCQGKSDDQNATFLA
jgi:hypothetical protein